jgi:hypothetical protein
MNGQVKESEFHCKLTYSLVGTVMEDGVKCRWVELHDVCPLDEKRKSSVVSKFLVSERDLRENEHPLGRVKRAWKKVGRRDAYLVEAEHVEISENPNLMIFPGMWQGSKIILKERIIDHQQGKLTLSEARTRTLSSPTIINRPRIGGFGKIESPHVEYTAWFDRTTSPVFSAATIQRKIYESDVLKTSIVDDLEVEDYGTDGTSKLPENN